MSGIWVNAVLKVCRSGRRCSYFNTVCGIYEYYLKTNGSKYSVPLHILNNYVTSGSMFFDHIYLADDTTLLEYPLLIRKRDIESTLMDLQF